MAVTVETLEKLERKIVLTLPTSVIANEVDARLKKMAKNVKMNGFRPGKVPMNVVAQQYGYSPEVILSGRRVNNNMPAYIAKKLTQSLLQIGKNPSQCKILIMGLTFKEDVSDIRNSKVADLAREIMGYSVNVHLVDPNASPNEVAHEYKLTLIDEPAGNYDAIIVAVAHADFRKYSAADFRKLLRALFRPS